MADWGTSDSGWGGGGVVASSRGPVDAANGGASLGLENVDIEINDGDDGIGHSGNDRACFNCGEPG